ncbi:protein brambleberry-like [Motacilla alba alba]|uniref:protein brambleberry-like n=1 Tax=Motacilla alba alba TaxID=1094192 RepID=UPI0018D53EDA|nr:protein brambleberry-like [Motacilla alba alba]
MRSVLDEIPVAQLMQDIAHRRGNVSSRGAAELPRGHQVFPSNLHQEQERPQDVQPQPGGNTANPIPRFFHTRVHLPQLIPLLFPSFPYAESILVLQEVMEKLQRVNQSLELMLTALEDARSRLEKHLEHLKAIPDLDGQSQSVTSSCIPHGSYFPLLVLPLVPASFRAILLLLFLASSALGIPAISTLLVLAAAGHWLLASACRGAGRIRPVAPREKARYRLTSTPERECDMELLQEELDRMEMSCLQNERCPQGGRCGSCRTRIQNPQIHIPILCWDVCHPRVSPSSARARATTPECPHTPPGGYPNPCHVLAEPSHPEQPQEVAGDIPKFTGQASPVPGGQRTPPSSCEVTLERVMDTGKLWEPKPCSPRTNMSPCQGLTRAGRRCRRKAIPGLEFCHFHTTGSSSATDSSPRF